jgi:hypothetical protein
MLVAVIVKALAELALMALLGRFLVGIFAGATREKNIFWQLLDVLARPVIKLTRWITPKVVLDQHVPLAAFFLLGFVWLIATQAKIAACLEAGVAACR